MGEDQAWKFRLVQTSSKNVAQSWFGPEKKIRLDQARSGKTMPGLVRALKKIETHPERELQPGSSRPECFWWKLTRARALVQDPPRAEL